MSKKVMKISGLESKVRWLYYFDPEVKVKNETCYFDTNCLQAAMLAYVYKSRPHHVSLHVFEEMLAKVSPKLLRENLNKMVLVG